MTVSINVVPLTNKTNATDSSAAAGNKSISLPVGADK
jgi:hypothetical protein